MTFTPTVPDQVVIRDNNMTLDGQNFPWYISQRGPWVSRLSTDLYEIDVEILELVDLRVKPVTKNPSRSGAWPALREVFFPWVITADGFQVDVRLHAAGMLKLAFLARDVDTDGEVFDLCTKFAGRQIRGLDGTIYQTGRELMV